MATEDFAIGNNDQLKRAVRATTSYEDSEDGVPETQLDELVNDAKRELYGRTGSKEWYADVNYGQALKAMTAITVKSAVENINIDSYSIADESISVSNADPEESQQIQLWMGQLSRALNQSDVGFANKQDIQFTNTSGYIG